MIMSSHCTHLQMYIVRLTLLGIPVNEMKYMLFDCSFLNNEAFTYREESR